MHPAHPSRAGEQASSVCTCRMNYSFVECGKLHNKKAECFFSPLVPITMTSQRSTSVFPDSLHFTFPWSPLDNGAKVAFSSNVGLTDTEYTLLSFACSLDEFFLENKIMKTIRPLNTEKKNLRHFVPLQPISFHKGWSLLSSSRRFQPGGILPPTGLSTSANVIQCPEVHLCDRIHGRVAALAILQQLE